MTEEVEEFGTERIDSIIWRFIGRKPVSQIAILAGIKPEEVLRRKKELLEEVDELTIQEKQQKILIELDQIAVEARERASRTSDEYYAGMINAAVSSMKAILVELNRFSAKQEAAVERLNTLRKRELLRLIDNVVVSSIERIATDHDLDETELMSVFQENLIEEAKEADNS